jgi:cytochrome c peroxidase
MKDIDRKGYFLMKNPVLVLKVFATAIATLLLSSPMMLASAQNEAASAQTGTEEWRHALYDPYPPGILPADLSSETARVEREVNFIFKEAIGQWHALPPPNEQGNPPTLQGSGYQTVEVLGKLLNFDQNMSPNKNEACGFCHMPYAGFSGPIPSVNLTMVAYPGSARNRANKRTAQRYPYAPDFPVLEYNPVQGLFFGGNFWDSRATGYKLQSADAEQAQHPPVDTGEMGFADTACIAFRLQSAEYKFLFEEVWGDSLDIRFPGNTKRICDTPGGAAILGASATPIALTPEDRAKANSVYDHWGQSLSKYERALGLSAFSSKFDAFLANAYTLSADEMAGYKLFDGKGNCNSCHLDGRSTLCEDQPHGCSAQSSSLADTGTKALVRPVFTCFGSANEGLPLNPRVAYFYENKPDQYGFTPNPYGFAYRDLGLGNFLRSGFGSAPNPNAEWIQYAPLVDGQMQVATARNAALTPTQCPTTEAPGPYFQKEFFHNGYIKSLKQLVHFYNTRDVYQNHVTSGHCPPGTTEKVDCWPMPEVPNNIDMTTGKLGLTDQEESQIVAFLLTLTDGFTTPYPDINTFTGKCMAGGTASTQGNTFIIPTPPLPPCASAICGVPPLPGPKRIP